jgi:RHS repeat-associated protein
VSSYTTNASNEMTANSNASYTYDSNGNTLTKTVGPDTTSYTWDYENRLTSVTLPGSGGTVTFKYDSFGRRIYKSSSAGTSVFAYDGEADNVVEETDNQGNVLRRYTQGPQTDEPLAEIGSGATSYYEQDCLGSVTSLSNVQGSLAQTYSYDSFGKQTAISGSITNPFRYTAREFDSETGIYDFRARYYDPQIGRFESEDPLSTKSDDLDLYSYVHNSPADETDPCGLGRWYDCGAGCRFRLETDPHKGKHVNWECNGASGCLLIPSLQPCEVGKSHVPPARILRCIKNRLGIPEAEPSPAPVQKNCPLPEPTYSPYFPWMPPGGIPEIPEIPIPFPDPIPVPI